MHTVKALIERFIEEMNGTNGQPGIKPLGESHYATLRKIARLPIGARAAEELKKYDVIDLCKSLQADGRCPATAQQYTTYLGGVLKYAPSAWADCEDVSDAALSAAKPVLVKMRLIGKSTPRKRIPSDEELHQLLLFLGAQDDSQRTKIKMVPVVLFGLASTRRRGEIVRLRRGDIDWQKRTYMIRDVKHPTKKTGNHKTFPLTAELEEIIRLMPVADAANPDELVFPFNGKSVGKRYIDAKHRLGIENLRLHDNRRAAITRWLALLKSPHRVKLISGHETTHILERVYDATDPATIHADLAGLQVQGVLTHH